jgi:hypothetical protein
LDLKHELAEQIKERQRQAALNGSNGTSSLSPSSIDLDHRINGNFF